MYIMVLQVEITGKIYRLGTMLVGMCLDKSGGLSNHIDPLIANYDRITEVCAEKAKELSKG